MIERLNRISASLAHHGITTSGQRCEVGLVLGSGLGHLVDAIDDARAIDYAEIDGFPRSTAPLHAGRLVFGTLQGRRVVAMQGRFPKARQNTAFASWRQARPAIAWCADRGRTVDDRIGRR